MKHSRLTRAALAVCSLLLASGCTSLQTVSVTSIPSDRSKPLEVEETNTAFLGIHFDNDFVETIPEQLREQCPGGKVTGILTKYESTWYIIIQVRSVTATAYCVQGDAPARKIEVSSLVSQERAL